MKRLLGAIVLTAVLGAAAEPPAVIARKALDALVAGRYDEFGQMLTPEAKALLTPEFLAKRVDGELKGFGSFEKADQPADRAMQEPATWSAFRLIFRTPPWISNSLVNESRAGCRTAFSSAGPASAANLETPGLQQAGVFHEHRSRSEATSGSCRGTITVPAGKGPFPAVVLVHGPGPNDRDESMYANRIFADIAEGLASRGIAVLRYDKRTRGVWCVCRTAAP